MFERSKYKQNRKFRFKTKPQFKIQRSKSSTKPQEVKIIKILPKNTQTKEKIFAQMFERSKQNRNLILKQTWPIV